MYRWFETSLFAARAGLPEPVAPCLAVTPAAFVQWLPMLGSVLYVPSRNEAAPRPAWSGALLSENALLAPLIGTHALRVLGVVSADGPREWIDCLDARGETLAQLHLLPDTDYLTWDTLPGDGSRPAPAHHAGRRRFFRSDAAHVVRFRCRPLANMLCLGEDPPPTLSPLGRVVAHAIAGSQPLLMRGLPMLP